MLNMSFYNIMKVLRTQIFTFSVIIILVFISIGCGPDDKKITDGDKSFETIEKEIEESYKQKADKIQDKINEIKTETEKEKEPILSKMSKLREDSIAGYENFLIKYQDSEYTPDVLVRLGEVYYERSEDRQIEAIREYEKKLENIDTSNPTTMDIEEPKPHYEDLIRVYQRLILKYPNFEYADVAHYGLGYCLASQGEDEDALDVYKKLVSRYPESRYTSECYLRIGDVLFDKYEFEKAIENYQKVSQESNYYDKALYKIGWCYFNLSNEYQQENYYKAIDAFCELLDYYQEHEDMVTELAQEAYEFSAGSIAELAEYQDINGLQIAIDYFDKNPREYDGRILHELGDVYMHKQDKVDLAMEVYESVLRRDPTYPKATEILTSMVEGYDRQQKLELANQTRQRIVDEYGPGSEWANTLTDREDKIKAIEVREENLYNVATFHHSQAQSMIISDGELPPEAKEEFVKAINRYRQYLYEYPGNEKAYKVNYFLADALYYVGDYWNAGVEYERVSLEYQGAKFKTEEVEEFSRADAAYNAVVAYSNLFDENKEDMEPPELKERKIETGEPEIEGGGTTEEDEPIGGVEPETISGSTDETEDETPGIDIE